jgi:hypothetical protein
VTVDKFFDDEGVFATIQMTSEILGLPVTENQYADIKLKKKHPNLNGTVQ